MRWPWSKRPKYRVRLDEDVGAVLQLWAHERNVSIDDLVRDVLRAVVPLRFKTGAPDAGKEALDAVFALLDESDRELGIAPTTEIASAPAPANQCLYLDGALPNLFRPGECAGICLHSSQRGRPCFWSGTSARQCPLFRPDSKYLLTTPS
jgi:hypothetical protein